MIKGMMIFSLLLVVVALFVFIGVIGITKSTSLISEQQMSNAVKSPYIVVDNIYKLNDDDNQYFIVYQIPTHFRWDDGKYQEVLTSLGLK